MICLREILSKAISLGVLLSVLFSGVLFGRPAPMIHPGTKYPEEVKREASQLVQRAFDEIKKAKMEKGITIEKEDVNSTGIIGPEFSPLVTTLGTLCAKRTAANPNFGGVIVDMFFRAGMHRGDVAAIGLSGSFPSLNIAALVAAESIGLEPIVISSIGSSTWGATHPDMTWLDMEAVLYKKGIIHTRSIAASVTGGKSQRFLLPEGYPLAKEAIRRNHLILIDEKDLATHLEKRFSLYETHSRGKPIKIFVNVGGAVVNVGDEESGLGIPSGLLTTPLNTTPKRGEGMIAIMLRRGIPVVNLLNVLDLAKKSGLPVDPVCLSRHGINQTDQSPRPLAGYSPER